MAGTALVVGASGGIGRAIAVRLANDGWDILAHGRHPGKLQETLHLVTATGRSCATVAAELTDTTQVQHLAEHALEHDNLRAVVFSAGGGRAMDSGPEALSEWTRTLDAILRAPMALTAQTLPKMRQTNGHYLFICGMYAKIGMPRMAAHCAGRHGLEGFSKALFEEVREDGVGVTLVHPGFVNTPDSDLNKLDPERMIHVDDIAAVVSLSLNSPDRTCVTEMLVRPQRSPYR